MRPYMKDDSGVDDFESVSDTSNKSEVDELEPIDEYWRASMSPQEPFEDADGADENGEWPVEIYGEEVDYYGNVKFEARWGNWQRKDGTDNTWVLNNNECPFRFRWLSRQRKRDKKQALQSMDIDVWTTTDIHNTNTRLRAQAYENKLAVKKRTRSFSETNPQKMAKLLHEKDPPLDDRTDYDPTPLPLPSRSGLRQTVVRTQSSRMIFAESPIPRAASILSSTAASLYSEPRSYSSKELSTEMSSLYSPPTKPVSFRSGSTISNLSSSRNAKSSRDITHSRRRKTQEEWSAAARNSGAAEIIITNEYDDENIPWVPSGFRYLEAEYKFSKGTRPVQDESFYTRCSCESCKPSSCECQSASELRGLNGKRTFAYTKEGLFAFNVVPGTEVLECNRYCHCNLWKCPNRVAQRPRDIPIEIFKTRQYGWGVRTLKEIQKGKVLGLYTGTIIHRKYAGNGDSKYVFDLDGSETVGETSQENDENKFSVDAKACGNWTRFINHSCSPNMITYSVIFDTIPEMNIPYLAFVALKDIDAKTELTTDYHPSAPSVEASKGKGKVKIPSGAHICECGSEECRGYIY